MTQGYTARMFYTEEAMRHGLDEAILINYLRLYISGNRARGQEQHNGRTYTYNTYEEIASQHPFWSKQKVGRMVRSLQEKGVILVDYLSEKPFDRTSYFAFVDEDSMLSPANHQMVHQQSIRCSTSEPSSYTKESLKNTEEGEGDLDVSEVAEYFQERGAKPRCAENMAHSFVAYYSHPSKQSLIEDGFRRRAATWFAKADKAGEVERGSSKKRYTLDDIRVHPGLDSYDVTRFRKDKDGFYYER